VQLTWYEIYDKFGKILGVDLLNNPELALEPKVAAEIIVVGMMKGLFTGVRLENYFDDNKTDAVNARRIINILDNAELISGYYKAVFNAIK
jgi:predicted chitinase